MKRDIEFKEPKWPVLKEFLPLKRSFNEEEHRAVPMEKEYGREEENLTMNCHYEKRHKSTLAIPKVIKPPLIFCSFSSNVFGSFHSSKFLSALQIEHRRRSIHTIQGNNGENRSGQGGGGRASFIPSSAWNPEFKAPTG